MLYLLFLAVGGFIVFVELSICALSVCEWIIRKILKICGVKNADTIKLL